MNAYARAFDPHSSYFSPRSSEEYRIQMSLNYDGIGASLQHGGRLRHDHDVLEGGPAAVAGTLKLNDRITGVGQGADGSFTDVIGWRLDDVVQLIRGKAGTVVRLQVLPAGAAPGTTEKVLRVHAQQGDARGAGGAQGGAHAWCATAAPQDRHHHRARLLPGRRRESAGDENYRSTTRDVLKLLQRAQDARTSTAWCSTCATTAAATCRRPPRSPGLFIDHGPGGAAARHHRPARGAG